MFPEGVTDNRLLQGLQQSLVLYRLQLMALPRVTLDFDGSVIGTGRFAEGTAFVSIARKKVSAVIIRCSVRWRGPLKYWRCCIVQATCTIRMAQRHSSYNVSNANPGC
jgi:hypothetical protein